MSFTGSSASCDAGAVSYTGVDQTNPIDAYLCEMSPDANSASFTMSTTTDTGGDWGVMQASTGGGAPLAGTNVVMKESTFSTVRLGDTNQGNDAGSVSMNWTAATAQWWQGLMVFFVDVSPPSPAVAKEEDFFLYEE